MGKFFTHSTRCPLFNVPPASSVLGTYMLFLLFLNFGGGALFGQTSEPTYEWDRAINLGTASVFNLDNIVISIDTDSMGNVYTLTLGNGIEKFNASGESLGIIVNGSSLNDPLDMVIDNHDIIYVADSGSKLIKKFDTSGNSKGSIGSGYGGGGKNEFWEPTGLAIDDQNNLYVVDAYRGSNEAVIERYFLKIYYTNGTFKSFQGTENHPLINPYRVGVDSKGKIYISHAANNGEVLVFGPDLNFLRKLINIGSPGSIVIGKNDFVHIIDYADKFDLSKILSKDVEYLVDAINGIQEGIANEEFGIQIYDPHIHRKFINKNLDLPLDIALFECEKMYVNDSKINGSGFFSELEFELDIFNRTSECGKEENQPPVFENCPSEKNIEVETDPGQCGAVVSFESPIATDDGKPIQVTRIDEGPKSGEMFPIGTTTVVFEADDGVNPPITCSFEVVVSDVELPVITCPSNISKTIPADQESLVVEFQTPSFSDNCPSATVEQTKGLASGSEFPVGTTEIEFTVTDASGNTKSCSFIITVTQEDEDLPPEFSNCPQNIQQATDAGKCGAVVTFDVPLATDEGRSIAVTRTDNGPKSGELFPVGTTTVVFETDDGVNPPVICSFEVVVADDERPILTSCPGDQTEGYNVENGLLLPNYTSQVKATDNCNFIDVVQSPSPNTIITEDTQITMMATDLAGNTTTCRFMVFLTEGETFGISCPGDQTKILDEACGFIIPDYTQVVEEEYPNAEVTQSVRIGQIISKKTTKITLTATLNGETDTCSFTLTLIDTISPEITCPGNQTENYDPEKGFKLPDYTGLATLSDNCEVVRVEQYPESGTLIHETTEITLSATDGFGNSDTCKFMVVLSEDEVLEITCPDDQTGNLNENCRFVVPDYRELARVSNSSAVIVQVPKPGETINQNTSIQLTATVGNETATCSFQLFLKDTIAPTAICASEITVQLNENGIANLAAEDIDNGSGDNCGIVDITINKTTFTNNDLGKNSVTLTVTDAAGNTDSCTTTVVVEPNGYNNDFQCKESIVLELETNGKAKLDPRDLFYGDGSDYSYSVDKEIFTCAELGENTVIFSYSGPDGNGSCEIEVLVEDPKNYCGEDPGNPTGPGSGSFLIVYPNPGNGLLKIAVSNDIVLTKADVFDMRGRLLYKKEFTQNSNDDYKLDIRNVQSGVYLLKLYGDDKIYYERVIISTY